MEQWNLFGDEFTQESGVDSQKKYTMKVESPIYEPKNHCPNILELYDNEKVKRMIREINNSSLCEMEKSALVIIDFDKSIEYGFTKLQKEIHEEWVKNQAIKERNNEE